MKWACRLTHGSMINPEAGQSVLDYSICVEVWSKSLVGSDKLIGMSTFSMSDIQQSKFARSDV